MRLGVDLDGVICNLDASTIGLTHALAARSVLTREQVAERYLSAHLLTHPQTFMLEDDSLIIVTGRSLVTRDWTYKWLEEHGLADFPIFFVSTTTLEELYVGGHVGQATHLAAQLKAEQAHKCYVDLFIDNNRRVVREMRRSGVRAICYRRTHA